jgi:hypothetical protein
LAYSVEKWNNCSKQWSSVSLLILKGLGVLSHPLLM